MKYTLRPYQQKAVEKLLWSRELKGADLCVLPTGAGKSLVIADLAHKVNGKILIIQPSKEILEQNMNKLLTYVDKSEIGVYSASVGRKDTNIYTFATIQSIYKKPEEFMDFTYVIIDECHMVNPKKKEGMYNQFFKDIGNPKVIGLTATPYRLDTTYERTGKGYFIAHTTTKLINRMKGHFWHRIIFNINNEDLMRDDYLMPLRYIDKSVLTHAQIPTNKSKSDFNLAKFEDKIRDSESKILEAIFFAEELCNHVLVFCSSIEQAEHLKSLVPDSEVVTSKTSKKERGRRIEDFRTGKVKTMFNVGVLTTGFDFPELDGIVLLRPTRSIGLYYQMLGRGVRKADGKDYCKVIDLTGTVTELGRIETIKLVKRQGWELMSETGYWHNEPMYNIKIMEQPKNLFNLSK